MCTWRDSPPHNVVPRNFPLPVRPLHLRRLMSTSLVLLGPSSKPCNHCFQLADVCSSGFTSVYYEYSRNARPHAAKEAVNG